MAGENKFKNKLYQGTFAGGQGPVIGQHTVNEEETKGIFGGEEQIGAVKSEAGSQTSKMHPTGDDGLFDLHGKSYAGPENFVPENKGVVNPFDIGK